jgi:hypothetical protein
VSHVAGDRVKETTTTTGTGDLTLAGAVANFRAFSAICADLDIVKYAIVHQSANEWETGLGTWHAGNTLTRTKVEASSNANAAVSFSAGTKDVFCEFTAAMGLLPPSTRAPKSDILIPPGTSAYVAGEFEVPAGVELEIGAGAELEIG